MCASKRRAALIRRRGAWNLWIRLRGAAAPTRTMPPLAAFFCVAAAAAAPVPLCAPFASQNAAGCDYAVASLATAPSLQEFELFLRTLARARRVEMVSPGPGSA